MEETKIKGGNMEETKIKRGRGRPKGSKNKPKVEVPNPTTSVVAN